MHCCVLALHCPSTHLLQLTSNCAPEAATFFIHHLFCHLLHSIVQTMRHHLHFHCIPPPGPLVNHIVPNMNLSHFHYLYRLVDSCRMTYNILSFSSSTTKAISSLSAVHNGEVMRAQHDYVSKTFLLWPNPSQPVSCSQGCST